MNHRQFATAATAFAVVTLGAVACTPAADESATDTDTTHTIVETREVPAAPVVIERQSPPVVVERDAQTGDSTTVRAGRDGIEVETTNR
ncbi:hypothetical protein [uncultured Brevundimonas sp.]|uniref:hypothetical protein n=1 Tax=uncultured Brevundimonas sp. TaxID=213418 RepID=UPI0030EF4EE0|tara:strand:+ start:2122 stop:2388 length:267 start_codon:yes stop_codon:yes gene_type:complete